MGRAGEDGPPVFFQICGVGQSLKLVVILYYHGFNSPPKVRVTWLLARPHGCPFTALMTGFGQSQDSMNAVNRSEIAFMSDWDTVPTGSTNLGSAEMALT